MSRSERIQQKLEDLLDDLKRLQGTRFNSDDVVELKERIHRIDEEWQEGAVHERDGSIAPGQAIISELLAEAHEWSTSLMEEAIDEDDNRDEDDRYDSDRRRGSDDDIRDRRRGSDDDVRDRRRDSDDRRSRYDD